ncbi:Acetoin:2,6-dichlorophenolindophenol oxidoreductase subunit beta [uncultured spirochete]|uniref:Acetoin:2,6-dichlorophenolindophenol oxidoreductase subunit beta n=1 Tax=uncultured spirochete TaxID=156406 RepID=A0A3P3XPW3_9SPIR|nr:Acetoin:2,6-dichlorophenolindophenol oxidoreductase subunit beta [uncultured spirochete]
MHEITYLQSIDEAQREEMKRDSRVFVMGEGVAHGVMGTSVGFLKEFGKERVRDTPISESGFTGVGIGAALVGMRPIVDFTIASFVYVAMDQLISMAAKCTYLYGGQAKVPIVFRACMYYGVSNAAQHSDRPYPIFMGVPGFKIIAPSTPYDMKGLLKTAIRDDDPVISFEDINLWGIKGTVPDEDYTIPFGQADVKRKGTDVTVVAIFSGVPMALAAADELAQEGVSVEVVDPRTLVPLDKAAILESVKKTGRLVVVDPAHKTCSVASEISSIVAEEGFWSLKAPIQRVTTDDIQVPFSTALEPQIYPSKEKIIAAVHKTLQ